MEDYRIDSNKLMYHPYRVSEWKREAFIYPIYIEISPTNRCNHRCSFCALDFLEYKNTDLEIDPTKSLLEELGGLDVKAVMFAGEGEPLLHHGIRELVVHAKEGGLDVSMTTNGSLLHGEETLLLENLSWIRISLDAGSPETYSKIHRCKEDEFIKVLNNLKNLVRLKKEIGAQCTIGVQFLLLSTNAPELVKAAKLVKGLGVDYFSVKPYSQHPDSKNTPQTPSCIPGVVLSDLSSLRTDKFSVIIRELGFSRVGKGKSYSKCLGLPFFCYIDSKGDVYTCSTYIGNSDFCYGNIYANTFEKIWTSDKRRQVLDHVDKLDISVCRENCRLDSINTYLWELKHPGAHINFI